MSLSNLRVRQLVDPSAEELERAVLVMDRAFVADVWLEMILGGPEGRKRFNARFFEANVAACPIGGGELWVAELSSQKSGISEIVGVACWYGPGSALFSREEAKAAGWDQLVAEFPPELHDWWFNYFIPNSEKHTNAFLGNDAQLDNWYLHMLGVAPEHHHKGIGRALVDVIKGRAFADGRHIYLEAGHAYNVEIYRKMGFDVMGSDHYDSPFAPGSQTLRIWTMMFPASGIDTPDKSA